MPTLQPFRELAPRPLPSQALDIWPLRVQAQTIAPTRRQPPPDPPPIAGGWDRPFTVGEFRALVASIPASLDLASLALPDGFVLMVLQNWVRTEQAETYVVRGITDPITRMWVPLP